MIEFQIRTDNQGDKSYPEGSGKSSGKSSGKILELMKKDKQITIPELAASLNISTRAIEKQIEKLKKENRLKRSGGRKHGFWEIN